MNIFRWWLVNGQFSFIYWLNDLIAVIFFSCSIRLEPSILLYLSQFCSSSLSFFFFVCNSSPFFMYILLLQGICPGNRLKIISYEATCYKTSPVSSPCPSIYYNNSILSSADSILYENTVGFGATTTSPNNQKLHGKRRSWHIMPNKVLYYHYFIYQTF